MKKITNLEQFISDGMTVEQLAAPVEKEVPLTEFEKQRHLIFATLLMAITSHYWNGNKYGNGLDYPLNPETTDANLSRSPYLIESYRGHNIAAIAVDGKGKVIDFEFNHNTLFNSSAEHAEARLLQRLFKLRQISDSWDLCDSSNKNLKYGMLLSNVTVYTTLESCSQCSGIMTLAGVKEVVYLQTDPGMYRIGNILRRLSKAKDPNHPYVQAPLPISGEDIGLEQKAALDEAFVKFIDLQTEKKEGYHFSQKKGAEPKFTSSVTSFLCTQSAYENYSDAEKRLIKLSKTLVDKDADKHACSCKGILSNKEALLEAIDFLKYTKEKGYRATPHGA